MSKDIIREEPVRASSRTIDEIKNKYIKTGVLKRWANERPFIDFERKIEIKKIGTERKARREIVSAIKTDIMAEEWGYPRSVLVSGPLVSAELDYGVFGDPTPRASRIIDETREIIGKGGQNVKFMSARTLLGNEVDIPIGYQEFENSDSVTGEKIMVRVSRNQGGVMTQEIGSDGRCISLAEIDIDQNGEYGYRLDLHFNGGRYQSSGGEINISSDKLPRATVKTFELLLGVVRRKMKETIIDVE